MDTLRLVLDETRRLAGSDADLTGNPFLPTSQLQDQAIAEGWGDAFLALADRYDAVIAAALPCRTCSRTYLREHWTVWNAFDDDGWHDSIRGRCPEGHERMIED